MARSLKFLFVNEQPFSLWNDCLDQLDMEDIKVSWFLRLHFEALKGEWRFNSPKDIDENSTECKSASEAAMMSLWGRMKSSSKLDKILSTLITLVRLVSATFGNQTAIKLINFT